MPRRNHPKGTPQIPKSRRPPKRRNIIALGASMKKAVVMKDRRAPRGGAKNKQKEYLQDVEDDDLAKADSEHGDE